MKKIRTTFIATLLSIFVIGILLLLIPAVIVSIKCAIILIRFLSLVVNNDVQITIEVTIVLVLVSFIMMILYHTFLHKFLPVSSKTSLHPAPARMKKLFFDYKFPNKKIRALHNRTTLLLDKQDNACNAYAYKSNIIVITNGFNSSNQDDEEKKAVLFHEFAHLVNKDNHIKYVLFGLNRLIILFSILSAAFFYIITICALLYLAPYVEISFLYKVSLFNGMIEFVIFTLCHLLNEIIEMVYMCKSRQAEYRADRFAADAGMKKPLINFLKAIPDYEIEKAKNDRYDFFDTHPNIVKRIDELEKL